MPCSGHLPVGTVFVEYFAMQIGICSYSFHRLLKSGQQDIFGYIDACKVLGCTQLDPWNSHLPPIAEGTGPLNDRDKQYLLNIRRAADDAGIPFGMLVVDGAHVYEPTPDARAANRAKALRHLDAAAILGAKQIRIDAGGPDELNDEVLEVLQAGYRDLIDRAAPRGIHVVVENHRGSTKHPDHLIRLLGNVPGLGFLFDTNNWFEGLRDDARRRCAPYAVAVHLKAHAWDGQGNEASDADAVGAIELLTSVGYAGTWGIESVPTDGDEMDGARKTVELIRRHVRQ
jgi:sugar phosphate isomerase/epimerase